MFSGGIIIMALIIMITLNAMQHFLAKEIWWYILDFLVATNIGLLVQVIIFQDLLLFPDSRMREYLWYNVLKTFSLVKILECFNWSHTSANPICHRILEDACGRCELLVQIESNILQVKGDFSYFIILYYRWMNQLVLNLNITTKTTK